MSVLRRAYVEVEPDVSNFDSSLKTKLQRADPGGKAGKQIGGQLNRALKRFDLDPIDVKADPKSALAGIAVAEARLRELGGQAATVEVKVQTEKALSQLKSFRRQLGDVGGDAAPGFAASFGARLGPLLAKLPIGPPILAAVGVVGAATAPLLGGAIAGGIIGGAGLGGVVGGLILAAKDARVAAAIDGLGTRIEGRLEHAAGAFVQPALQGLKQIETAADTIDIESIFRSSAGFVPVLTSGVTSALTDLGDGVEELIGKAGPVIGAFSRSIASVGSTLGDSFKLLATDAGAGASSVDDLTLALTNFITISVGMIHGLAQVKAGLDGLDSGIDSARAGIEDFFTKMSGGRAEFDITADGMGVLERRTKDAAGSAGKLNTASVAMTDGIRKAAEAAEVGKASQQALTVELSAGSQASIAHSRAVLGEVGAMHDLNDALRAQVDPLFAVITAQNGLKTAQDKSAEAIRKHGRSSNEAKEANRNLAAAALDLQGKTSSLAQGFDGRLTPSMRATFKAAGLTRTQIRDVEGQLVTAKRAADKFDGKYLANVGITGDKAVMNRLLNLAAYQNALKKGSSNIASIRKGLSGDNADFLKFDVGGRTPDAGVHEAVGVVHGKEFVFDAKTTANVDRQAPGFLEQVHAGRGLPGYAGGGRVAWPFPVNASGTKVPSAAEVASKVIAAVPSGGRTSDWIEATAKALVPGIRVLSKDRPGARTLSGNQSYHALGRAVDFAPSEKLARLWNERYKPRTKELISPYQQYNLHNGARHTYTGAIWNQHNFAGGNAHDHIAMDDGGFRMLQPGMNMIPNGTGKPELIGGPAAMASRGDVHVHLHGSVIASERQAVEMITKAYKTAVKERKIVPGARA